jgi:hypothetical protein
MESSGGAEVIAPMMQKAKQAEASDSVRMPAAYDGANGGVKHRQGSHSLRHGVTFHDTLACKELIGKR